MVAWDYKRLPVHFFNDRSFEYVDNAIKAEYDSGRVTLYKKNTLNKRKISISYFCDNKKRLADFFDWYENTLGGNGVTFTLKLTNSKECEYFFTDPPSVEGFQTFDISMTLQEV